jgi:hypothetical protein
MPTLKQRLLAKQIADGKNIPMKDMMINAGYSERTAWGSGQRTIHSMGFVQLLDEMGCSDKRIAKALKAGLEAKNGRKADLLMRHRYLETIMKAKNLISATDNNPMSGLSEFIEGLKGFQVDVLIAIKQRLNNSEPVDVTPTA